MLEITATILAGIATFAFACYVSYSIGLTVGVRYMRKVINRKEDETENGSVD